MALLKCKICGKNMDIEPGSTVCTCSSCNTKQTLPQINNPQAINMLNRATYFRQQYEFDKAQKVYTDQLRKTDSDPELHWCVVLCRYGIEYIHDPLTGQMKAICHRAHSKTILEDDDYTKAIQLADDEQRELYREEAQYIDTMQKQVLEEAAKEPPYDVFICYKQYDENGENTRDSALAAQIDQALTAEGLKIFCIQDTLKGMPSTSYEPHIFAALHSATVMIVVGTKPEYFRDVWVRNDWNRFLKLMQTDATKRIIPTYIDMDPFEMPDELNVFQAQNMSNLSFLTDLIKSVHQALDEAKVKKAEAAAAPESPAASKAAAKRAKQTASKTELQHWTEEKVRLEKEENDIYEQIRKFRPSESEHKKEIAEWNKRIDEIDEYSLQRDELKRKLSLYEHIRDAYPVRMRKQREEVGIEIAKTKMEIDQFEINDAALMEEKKSLQKKIASVEELDVQKRNKERKEYEAVMVVQLEKVKAAKKTATQKLFEIARTSGNLKRGDLLAFGSFEGESINWIVLSIDTSKMLLLTEDIVDTRQYQYEREDITWADSDLRKWLNHDFLEKCFSEEELDKVITTKLKNPDNTEYNVRGGETTEDKFFLLGVEDLEILTPQQQNINGWWWLRSPGCTQYRAAAVNVSGQCDPFGGNVNCGRGVRPACWVSLD